VSGNDLDWPTQQSLKGSALFSDWKHASIPGLSVPGSIIGCDFSGTVAHISSLSTNPNNLQVGDKVAGMVHGGKFSNKGSYAEYLKVPGDLVWKIPSSVSLRDAPVYGVGFVTAAGVSQLYHCQVSMSTLTFTRAPVQVIYNRQGHEFPPAKISGDHWVSCMSIQTL